MCARHALALASLMAREPQVGGWVGGCEGGGGVKVCALQRHHGSCCQHGHGHSHILSYPIPLCQPQGSASYIDAVGPLLRNNVDVAAATGTLFSRAGAGGPDGRKTGGGGPGAPPPSVVRDDAETHVNLR